MKFKNLLIAVALIVAVASVYFFGQLADSMLWNASTFREHVGVGNCIYWDTEELNGNSTETITSRCAFIDSCIASIESVDAGATTTPSIVICNPVTQTGTNTGKLYLSAQNAGGSFHGDVTVSYIVMGYGGK